MKIFATSVILLLAPVSVLAVLPATGSRFGCEVEPFTRPLGKDYRGPVAVTETGRTCQRWDTQSPQAHTRTVANYPNSGLDDNYCRNPDNEPEGPWCYTTDPNSRWEYCNIPCGSGHSGPGTSGDPHVKTWGGRLFDFHGGCDLVLVSDPQFNNGQGLDVHIRTKINTWWSYVDKAALRIGHDILEVKGEKNAPAKFWINGKAGVLNEEGELDDDVTIGGNKVTYKERSKQLKVFRIFFGNGDTMSIQAFSEFLKVEFNMKGKYEFKGAVGLMGSYPEGELLSRDGTLMTDTDEFGKEWQVRLGEPRLFSVVEGVQHPEICAMPDEQTKEKRTRRLGESTITEEEAAIACSHVHQNDRDICIFDVLATQNKDMGGAY